MMAFEIAEHFNASRVSSRPLETQRVVVFVEEVRRFDESIAQREGRAGEAPRW
jgi:hypothetical protein